MRVTGEIEQPHVRAWSTVFRAPTDDGDVYLKLCGPNQSHEPALTLLLAREDRELVPDVIDVDLERSWLLLADGGVRLRDARDAAGRVDAFAELLPRYARLQRRLLRRDADLLATGTPDRRLERIPALVHAMLDDERGDVPPEQRDGARALVPAIERACRALAALGLGASVQHDDLHDANVLVRDGRAVVFDWGDACVTQPLASIGIPLRAVAHALGTDARDARVVRVRDAYLAEWPEVAPAARDEVTATVLRVEAVLRALSWYAVAAATGWPEDPYESLRGWLDEVETHFSAA